MGGWISWGVLERVTTNRGLATGIVERRAEDSHLQAQVETFEGINVQWWKPVPLSNSTLQRATGWHQNRTTRLGCGISAPTATHQTRSRDRPTSDPYRGSESNSEREVDRGQGSSLPWPGGIRSDSINAPASEKRETMIEIIVDHGLECDQGDKRGTRRKVSTPLISLAEPDTIQRSDHTGKALRHAPPGHSPQTNSLTTPTDVWGGKENVLD